MKRDESGPVVADSCDYHRVLGGFGAYFLDMRF